MPAARREARVPNKQFASRTLLESGPLFAFSWHAEGTAGQGRAGMAAQEAGQGRQGRAGQASPKPRPDSARLGPQTPLEVPLGLGPEYQP